MKQLVLVILAIGAFDAYIRLQQPQIWNNCLDNLKAPEASTGFSPVAEASSPVPTSSASAPAAPTSPITSPVPPAVSATSEVISPNSSFTNSDHVKQVDQPEQTPASSNAANSNAVTNPSKPDSSPNSPPVKSN